MQKNERPKTPKPPMIKPEIAFGYRIISSHDHVFVGNKMSELSSSGWVKDGELTITPAPNEKDLVYTQVMKRRRA